MVSLRWVRNQGRRWILRLGPWQGDPRGRIPRRTGAHPATRCRRPLVLRARGEGAAGGASRPWERGRATPPGRSRGTGGASWRGGGVGRSGGRGGGQMREKGEPKARARRDAPGVGRGNFWGALGPGLSVGGTSDRAPCAPVAGRDGPSPGGPIWRVWILASSLCGLAGGPKGQPFPALGGGGPSVGGTSDEATPAPAVRRESPSTGEVI